MKYIIFLFFISCLFPCIAQKELTSKSKKAIALYQEADNFRVRGEYATAEAMLKEAIQKDDDFVEAYYRLGLTYMSMRAYPKAVEIMERGLSKTSQLNLQRLFWIELGEAYISTGQHDKALSVLDNYLKSEANPSSRTARARSLRNNAAFALANKDDLSGYQIKPLSDTVNQHEMQYFPVLTGDHQQLIFTRRLTHNPNDDEDLLVSVKDGSGRWTSPKSISKNINSVLNEGTCSVSADGRKLIFTSCVGRGGYGSCDLYESNKKGADWSMPVNLGPGVNTSAWESQPSLSADGRTLYFVSERKSGYGRRDIWVSTLGEDGKWSKAENAGKRINSAFDEISPFIHVNGRTLFFASSGLPGFGGYDIYYSEKDSTWGAPRNLGAPLNNHHDQYSIFITADGSKAYYSYEVTLADGTSRSKLYEATIPKEAQMRLRSNYVKGIVRDRDTKALLDASIELIDLRGQEMISLVHSDSITGEYLFILTQGSEYALHVSRAGYLFKSMYFNYSSVEDLEPIVLDIELEKIKKGSVEILSNIFFAFNAYDLQEKSVAELQRLVRFLNQNPGVSIEIGGHTDNIGTADYNIALSEKRAKSVYDYLVSKKISPSRMKIKGYGSGQPIADNNTEDGRQRNRRIEFKIL